MPHLLSECLNWAIELLPPTGDARRHARTLMAHVLGKDTAWVFSNPDASLTEPQKTQFEALIKKCAAGAPISRVMGRREFWDLSFRLSDHTLDPRPDSETLIETVMTFFKDDQKNLNILDLGTGTGCLLITLLKLFPKSTGVAVDLSPGALETAQLNAADHGVLDRMKPLCQDWSAGVLGAYDIIISNPPYIPEPAYNSLDPTVKEYDPRLALVGGQDGLECYRGLASILKNNTKNDTKIFLEIGCEQALDVQSIFKDYTFLGLFKDLENRDRVLVFGAPSSSATPCIS